MIGLMLKIKIASKKCIICLYWYFLDKGFTFQPAVCNRCHDKLMMSMKLHENAVLNIHGADYCSVINRINKSEAVNLPQGPDLSKKVSH